MSTANQVTTEKGDSVAESQRKVCFKDPNYQRAKMVQDKRRTWKSLKQIVTLEKSLPWDKESVHYSSIDAPPSLKPAKKYSDISGLPAKYRDPITNLYYANAEEYQIVKSLPNDIVSGYLSLRKANVAGG